METSKYLIFANFFLLKKSPRETWLAVKAYCKYCKCSKEKDQQGNCVPEVKMVGWWVWQLNNTSANLLLHWFHLAEYLAYKKNSVIKPRATDACEPPTSSNENLINIHSSLGGCLHKQQAVLLCEGLRLLQGCSFG